MGWKSSTFYMKWHNVNCNLICAKIKIKSLEQSKCKEIGLKNNMNTKIGFLKIQIIPKI